MKSVLLIAVLVIFGVILVPVFAQTLDEAQILFKQANQELLNGKYNESISIYDNILEKFPNNISTLKMKSIALSNLGEHEK